MTIEVLNNETVIKIPKSIEFKYFQKLIDYINVVTIINKSKASDAEITDLSEEVQFNWWKENKHKWIK